MTSTDQQCDEIIAGLSIPVKAGLFHAFPVADGEMAWAFSTGTCEVGVELGLAKRGPSWEWPKLTPLGLAVRRRLRAIEESER